MLLCHLGTETDGKRPIERVSAVPVTHPLVQQKDPNTWVLNERNHPKAMIAQLLSSPEKFFISTSEPMKLIKDYSK